MTDNEVMMVLEEKVKKLEDDYKRLQAKAEAYKEFAEKLNRIAKFRSLVESDNYELSVTMREVDNLLKELVGDK